MVVVNTTDDWNDMYGQLITYLEENNNNYPIQDGGLEHGFRVKGVPITRELCQRRGLTV